MNMRKCFGAVAIVALSLGAVADEVPVPEIEAFAINGRFNIHFLRSDAATYGYEVELSEDGETWTPVYEESSWRGRGDGGCYCCVPRGLCRVRQIW